MMVGKKLGKAVWYKTKERLALRPGLAVAAMVAVDVAFLVWRPSDDRQPVQSAELAVSHGAPEIAYEGSVPGEPVMTTPNRPPRRTRGSYVETDRTS